MKELFARRQEIITVDDQPALKGVLPLRARSIQRLELRRDLDSK